MRNRDKVMAVIKDYFNDASVMGRALPGIITQALADADLIAPELPAPAVTSANGTPVWRAPGTFMVTIDGEVHMLLGLDSEVLYTLAEARDQAHSLLAAADHAEKGGA